jgi:hypothetical protein
VNAFGGLHFDADAALLYNEAIEALNDAGSQKLSTLSHEQVPDATHSAKNDMKSQGKTDEEARDAETVSHLQAATISLMLVVFVCISAQPCTRETMRWN